MSGIELVSIIMAGSAVMSSLGGVGAFIHNRIQNKKLLREQKEMKTLTKEVQEKANEIIKKAEEKAKKIEENFNKLMTCLGVIKIDDDDNNIPHTSIIDSPSEVILQGVKYNTRTNELILPQNMPY